MSKRKSERLVVVRKLAEQKEQEAANTLLEQRQRLDYENHQLQQLQEYYTDYVERIEQQKQTTIVDVVTYREFSQRLLIAVKQQEQKIAAYAAHLQTANQQWILLREKRRAIEDVIEKSRGQEQSELDRLEQKTLDEIAANQHASADNGQRNRL